MILARIEAPHFVAGLDIEARRVTRTAPILAYMAGWPVRRVLVYCKRKQWLFRRVPSHKESRP